MKVYVTTRFKGAENKTDVEALCTAVRAAGMEDFSFVRDIEGYQKIFDDPRALWRRSRSEVRSCDALLIDVSDSPSGGRVVEVGMAYALEMPIFVIAKRGSSYKPHFDGVADLVITYDAYGDITAPLAHFLQRRVA